MLKIKRAVLIFLLFLSLPLFLFSKNPEEDPALFAGTLLAFYPTNTPRGIAAIQPFLFTTRQYGTYGQEWDLKRQKSLHQLQLLAVVETGIVDQYLDVNLALNAFYSQIGNKHSPRYGDTQLYLGSQLLVNQRGTWIPDFRLILLETFPTGTYKNLKPQNKGSDASGLGTYQTAFGVVVRKIFFDLLKRPFNFNLNLFYILSTKTAVNGLSVYGGGSGTRGVVNPGDQFIANLAFEQSLTRYWGWGIDMRFEHQNKTSFSRKGNDLTPSAGLPSSERFSLAPCVEYNFSELLTVEAGTWFTIAGRNSNAFVSGVVNVYYAF